ncbi:MAG: cyanophycinase [Fidelibacterota bacterium]|nr:MAG: cyanophycinase [Candidatus Neomarinimicrobiota bacterium]
MMQKIVQLAGADSARILIVPNASSDPVGTAEYQRDQFVSYGVTDVDFVNLTQETADQDTNLEKLEGVTGIFFSGGVQGRLQQVLHGTAFLDRIRTIYQDGGVISGTSAGAAVMSEVMITGDELISKDTVYAFSAILQGNIETWEGFGLVKKAIIDQHFLRRKRHNRLITLVLEHPELVGVGIDESTAIIVNPDDTFEVLGERTVMVLDASRAEQISTDSQGNLSASGIVTHVLRSGQKYDLNSRRVIGS